MGVVLSVPTAKTEEAKKNAAVPPKKLSQQQIFGTGTCTAIIKIPDVPDVYVFALGSDLLAISVDNTHSAQQIWKVQLPAKICEAKFSTQTGLIVAAAEHELHVVRLRSGTVCAKLTIEKLSLMAVKVAGHMVFAGASTGDIKAWHLETGEEKLALKMPYWTTQLQTTGPMLIACDYGGHIKAWHLETGEEKLASKLPFPITHLQTTGHMVIAGDRDGHIKAWHLETSEEKLASKLRFPITQLQTTGHMVIAGDEDGHIKAWHLETSEEKLASKLPVWITQLQTTGHMVIAGDFQGHIKAWDLETSEEKLALKMSQRITQLQTTGHMLIAGDWGGHIKAWHLETSEQKFALKLPQNITQLQTTGHMVIAGDEGGRFKAWSLDTTEEICVSKMPQEITKLQTKGHMLIASDYRRYITGWSLETSEQKFALQMPHRFTQLQTTGHMLIAGDWGGHIKAWHLETSEQKLALEMSSAITQLQTIGPMFIAADDRGHIKAWDIETVEEKFALELPHRITRLQTKGHMLIVGDIRGYITAWSLETSEQKLALEMSSCITQLQTTGPMFIAADDRGHIKAWHLETGEEKFALELPKWITHLQTTGHMVIAGDEGGHIKAWHLETSEEKLASKLRFPITQLQTTGHMVIAGDEGGHIKAWHLETSEEKLALKMPQKITQLQTTDHMVIAGDAIGHIKAWSLKTSEKTSMPSGRPDQEATLVEFGTLFVGEAIITMTISPSNLVCIGTNMSVTVWNVGLLQAYGINVHGAVGYEYQKAHRWMEWFTIPASYQYSMSLLSLFITVAQVLAFCKGLRSLQTTESMFEVLEKFQTLGISESTLQYWKKQLPAGFIIFLVLDALALASYSLAVLVVNGLLQKRCWYKVESKMYKAWQLLDYYAQGMATVGFVPMLKGLLRVVPCDPGHVNMLDDAQMKCHSVGHVAMISTALVLGAFASLTTWRLAKVGFSMRALCVKANLFDSSEDALPKDRQYNHPLSLNDLRYDEMMVLVKIALCLTSAFAAESHVLHSAINLACAAALLLLGIRYDKYWPGQVKKGRLLEPNSVCTMLDAGTCFYFFLVFIACMLEASGKDLSFLNSLAILVLPSCVLGYFGRDFHWSARCLRSTTQSNDLGLSEPLLSQNGAVPSVSPA